MSYWQMLLVGWSVSRCDNVENAKNACKHVIIRSNPTWTDDDVLSFLKKSEAAYRKMRKDMPSFRRLLHRLSFNLRRIPSPATIAYKAAGKTRILFKRFIRDERPGETIGRIELSLTPDYVDWGVWSSVREFFQNAKDADDVGNKMTVAYDKKLRTLRIATNGAHLERKTLVLGGSTKRDTDQRGKFGEGYKLAIASLLHRGHSIKIYNWDEIWIPKIEYSKVFKTKVLVIHIVAATDVKPEIVFEVDEISAIDFKEINTNLLFGHEAELSKTSTKYGTFLPQKEWSNLLFVRGIYVATLPGAYKFGYDLRYAKLNRDRDLADPWSLKREIHNVIDHALELKLLDPDELYKFVEQNFDEGAAIRDSLWSGSLVPPALVKAFETKHGADAIPVCTNHDNSLAHILGREPIFVNTNLHSILSFGGLDIEKYKRTHSTDFARVYELSELTKNEQDNLKIAVELVSMIETFAPPLVVDYFKDGILGLYDGGKISLSRETLQNLRQAIAVLVHEVSHRYGGDGTARHREAEERIFSSIITKINSK